MTTDQVLPDFDVIPRDTTREAWAVLTQGLRRLDAGTRAGMAIEMSDSLRQIVRGGVRHRHPDWYETSVKREAFRIAYGDRLFNEAFGGRPVHD
jgi:hypothetical protein